MQGYIYLSESVGVINDQPNSPTIVPNPKLPDQFEVKSQVVTTQGQSFHQRRTDTTESVGDGELCFIVQLPYFCYYCRIYCSYKTMIKLGKFL